MALVFQEPDEVLAVAVVVGVFDDGGAAGGSIRKGDLLCIVSSHAEALMIIGRFMQYYREHGKYLERTYHFLERLGIAAQLDAEIQKAVDAYVDPWKEADRPPCRVEPVPFVPCRRLGRSYSRRC